MPLVYPFQFRDHAPGEPTGRTTMNDSYPSRKSTDKPQEKRSLLERLTDFISPEPESRSELL